MDSPSYSLPTTCFFRFGLPISLLAGWIALFAGRRGSLLLTGLVLLVLLLLLSAVLLILPFLTLIRLRTLICHSKTSVRDTH